MILIWYEECIFDTSTLYPTRISRKPRRPPATYPFPDRCIRCKSHRPAEESRERWTLRRALFPARCSPEYTRYSTWDCRISVGPPRYQLLLTRNCHPAISNLPLACSRRILAITTRTRSSCTWIKEFNHAREYKSFTIFLSWSNRDIYIYLLETYLYFSL